MLVSGPGQSLTYLTLPAPGLETHTHSYLLGHLGWGRGHNPCPPSSHCAGPGSGQAGVGTVGETDSGRTMAAQEGDTVRRRPGLRGSWCWGLRTEGQPKIVSKSNLQNVKNIILLQIYSEHEPKIYSSHQ